MKPQNLVRKHMPLTCKPKVMKDRKKESKLKPKKVGYRSEEE